MADRIIYNLDHDGRFSMRLEDILDPTGGPGQLAVAQKALAIVQRLAREMCTNVEVRSRLGKGSVFRLWLDNWQGALEDEAQPVLDPQSLAGLRVLAIDDDEAVRMGMQSLLQSWGCECLTAESGADAEP